MKVIFFAITFVALITFISITSIKCQVFALISNSYNYIISQVNLDINQISLFDDPKIALIYRVKGNNNYNTIVNFHKLDINTISDITLSSIYNFVIYNVDALSESKIMQLYILNKFIYLTFELVTWNSVNSININQNYDIYKIFSSAVTESSMTIDDSSWIFSCQFESTFQFLIKFKDDDDYITWFQDEIDVVFSEAYIQVNN